MCGEYKIIRKTLQFMTFYICDFITDRSRVIKKFSSRSQSKISWPPLF